MEEPRKGLFAVLAFCVLGAALYLTMALISPPAALPVDAPAAEFSAGRAMRDLAIIAKEPHPMGAFPAHAAVRDYLLGEIRKLGLEPQVQDTFGVRLLHPGSGSVLGGFVENILVRLPGTNPEGAILLMSHYDTTPGGPGGVDSSSGVVTILELLRALHASPALRQDVIILFTDGEEPGTLGSHAFVAQHPWLNDVRLTINLDQVRTGLPMLLKTSQGNGLWVSALARSVTRPTYISLPFDLFPGGETDLVPFTRAGILGADIMTSAPFAENHTALDRPELVHSDSVQQTGNHYLALVRYLGDQATFKTGTPDQTFFPVLGRLVHYPVSWALPLVVLAGLCFLGTIIYSFGNQALTWRGVGLGFLTFLFSLGLSVGIANLLWLGIQALHPEYEYSIFRAHLSDDVLYAVGFFILALAVSTASIALARKRITALDLAAGALIVWFPGSIAAAVLVPATSYLATWMLLSGSLALLLAVAVRSKKNAWTLSRFGFLFSAILATCLWVPVIYVAFLGSSFPLLWLMIGVAALWLGAMLPALDWITSPKRWLLPSAALLTSLGFLLAGHFLVGRSSPLPIVNSIGYWLAADSREAYWVAFIGGYRMDAQNTERIQAAFPEEMDERQNHLLANPVRRSYTGVFLKAPQFSVLTSEAPPLALDGPRLEVITDGWAANRRVIRIKITTSMHDRIYIIIPDAPLLAITVPSDERIELPPSDGNEWWLRFDGTPVEGLEISFETSAAGPIQFLIVEERTGLPSFPGLTTQPEPGRMESPGEFLQGVASDFTAIYRSFVIPGSAGE